MSEKIFISYRRASTPKEEIAKLHQRLEQVYGKKSVFFDIESIESGARFPDRINQAVIACEVFILVAGPRYEEIFNERIEKLDKEVDYVFEEINLAIETKKKKLVVLINRTQNVSFSSFQLKTKRHSDNFSSLNLLNSNICLTDENFETEFLKLTGSIDLKYNSLECFNDNLRKLNENADNIHEVLRLVKDSSFRYSAPAWNSLQKRATFASSPSEFENLRMSLAAFIESICEF